MPLPESIALEPQLPSTVRESYSKRKDAFSEADFAALYDRHVSFVWRTLRLLGVPDHSLDDAVQEVFVVVYKKRRDFEGRSEPQTWLYAICRRLAANVRRSLRRKAPGEPLPVSYPSSAPTPVEDVQRRQVAEFVREFSENLSEEKQDVFVLCLLEGLSVPQAAETLGANINTIYSRLRAVRSEFRRAAEDFRASGAPQGDGP